MTPALRAPSPSPCSFEHLVHGATEIVLLPHDLLIGSGIEHAGLIRDTLWHGVRRNGAAGMAAFALESAAAAAGTAWGVTRNAAQLSTIWPPGPAIRAVLDPRTAIEAVEAGALAVGGPAMHSVQRVTHGILHSARGPATWLRQVCGRVD